MKNLVLILLIIQASFLNAQSRSSIDETSLSIYEYGDSITDCKTNFINLFANWTSQNITNADSYKLLKYSFVETISDSLRFNFYRNYFSGSEPVYGATKSTRKVSMNGKSYYEFYIVPGFIHQEIYDPRGLSPETREIFSKDFKSQAINILSQDINIDTMKLNYYFFERHQTDTTREWSSDFNAYGVSNRVISDRGASPDSISRNYIAVCIEGTKRIEELSVSEKRSLILEQLLIERINKQLFFNEQVHIGDKVYVVDLRYNDKPLQIFVICSAESKKVVLDYFFSNINANHSNSL